jgi:uncharacterized cupredoxin-like copper-binding protein
MGRRQLAALAACGLVYAGMALAPAHGATPGPTRVLVRAEEYDLLLSQLKVNPGEEAIVQLYNAGEDSHDLQIQRIGDSEQFSIGELPPGEVGELALRLRRDSRYVMWCSLPNHRELGMEASLRVRRKRH